MLAKIENLVTNYCSVYPSYNAEGDWKGSAVLLCSYSWGADSERIASMIEQEEIKKPHVTDQLVQVMLKNLARLHTVDDEQYKKLQQKITDEFETYHAYDWSTDPYTCGGAFALFSPSQFSRLYPALVQPLADSRLHIIGEAASAHHAWVAGALESAARAVYLMLGRFEMFKEQKIITDEFGKTGEVDETTDYLQIALGMLSSKQRAGGGDTA